MPVADAILHPSVTESRANKHHGALFDGTADDHQEQTGDATP